jgi:RimJ/RimL family protein N-acetyltransferase
MSSYKILKTQKIEEDGCSIVPIRSVDRFEILKWRNEQIYHLRQDKPLSIEDQNEYFQNTIQHLFDQDRPNQILFSLLENEICIGYGGLVHINWIDKNAEISFILDTKLENIFFAKYLSIFLKMIEKVAFQDLNFHKIYSFAFDIRPHLYPILELGGFVKDATLKDHCFFNGEFKDVVMHYKLKNDSDKQ